MGPACRFDLFSIIKAVWKSFGPRGLAADLVEQSLPTPNIMRRICNDRPAGCLVKLARPAGAPRRPSRQGPPGQVGRARVTELWLCCGCGWLAQASPAGVPRRLAGCGCGWLWWLLLAVAVAAAAFVAVAGCGCGWPLLRRRLAVAVTGCGCGRRWQWQWLAVAVRWLRLVRLARAGEPATSTAKGQGSRKCYSKSFIFKEFTDFS